MAGPSGRKSGVNGSHYIADLNKVPSTFDVDRSSDEAFGLDDELAQFTNAEFLDFDAGNFLDGSGATAMDFSSEGQRTNLDTKGNQVNKQFADKGMRHLLRFRCDVFSSQKSAKCQTDKP